MGPGEGMQPVDNSELKRLHGLASLDVLRLFAEHSKLDRDFPPVCTLDTRRVCVTALGAVELVMHLWRTPFPQPPKMLREVGA